MTWRWRPTITPNSRATGDLSGRYPDPTVIRRTWNQVAVVLSSNVNDWVIPGLTDQSAVSIDTAAGNRIVSGIVPPTSGGVIEVLMVNNGPDNVTFQHENVGSTAANRIIGPEGSDFILSNDSTQLFVYDPVVSHWRILGLA